MSSIRIATRGSALALAQANLILAQCRAAVPGETYEIRVIKTTGDKLQTASLAGGDLPKGLFTKELEAALLSDEADLAVHSLKDLPTELPEGLRLGAVSQRADVRDLLVYRHIESIASIGDATRPTQQNKRGFKPELSIDALPWGATVATSSTRRSAQLLERRADLQVVPIRGNVGTRLRKLSETPQIDATILAAAGMGRLGFTFEPGEQIQGEEVPPWLAVSPIPIDTMLPCVGQAAIGIEIRDGDSRLAALCTRLNDPDTFACVAAERAFLSAMGGGCHLAVAAFAEKAGEQLRIRGVSYLRGNPRRGEVSGSVYKPESIGRQLATQLG